MKKSIKSILLTLTIMLCILKFNSCTSDHILTIDFTLKNIDSGKLLIQYQPEGKEVPIIDTIDILKGKATFKNKINEVANLSIYFDKHFFKKIFVSPGKVLFIAENDSTIKVSGTKIVEEFNQYEENNKSLYLQQQQFFKNFYSEKITKKDIEEMQKGYSIFQAKQKTSDSIYFSTNVKSKIVPALLYLKFRERIFNENEVEKFYNLLDESVKKSYYGVKILQALSSTPTIGKKLQPLTLPDINGKNISISDYNGKVVLLDFWASWCGPCRNENPALVNLYKKYHPLGLEILGISLDGNKEDWLKAIKEDGLTWQHVSDLKEWESIVCSKYDISFIPFTILLNKEGVVVFKTSEKNTHEDLEKSITQLLKQ